MSLAIPIGVDDFRTLREQGLAYVDKSHLIREVKGGDAGQKAGRPRRKGR